MLEDGQELTVTAAGQISRLDTSGSRVKLTVSGLTLRYQDTFFREKNSGCLIYLDQEVPGAVPGCCISFTGKVSLPNEALCPGQYDASLNMEALHIGYLFYDAVITDIQKRFTLQGVLSGLRQGMTNSYERIYPPRESGVLCALTLGDSQGMDDDLRDLYAAGGISHMLAISGMHIGFAGMGLYHLLRRRRVSIRACAAAAGSVTFCFCLMTGMSVSARRALIMFFCWLIAQAAGRTYDSFCAAALALLVIVLPTPAALTQSGLWLSFGCVLSLQIVGPFMREVIGTNGFRASLASSGAVFLGTLPLTCFFFWQFSPLSALVNLLAIPLLPVLMVLGLLSGVAGMFCYSAGVFLAGGCRCIISILNTMCRITASLPFGTVITGRAPLWHVAASYAVLGGALIWCALMKPSVGVKRLILAAAAAVMVCLCFRPSPKFRVDFLDVGQGDCTLISSGRTDIMIDCGSSSEKNVWDKKIENALKYYGIGKLDAVFITHGDNDHYSAFEDYLEKRNTAVSAPAVKALVTGENTAFDEELQKLVKTAAGKGMATYVIRPGTSMRFGKMTIRCLYPSAEQCRSLEKNGETNILSLTTEVLFGSLRILLPGDLEGRGEEMLVQSCGEEWKKSAGEEIRILKCGHHGSAGASGGDLIDAFSPDEAVISCGRNNRYGHPAGETLERLYDAGVLIYRTDMSGTGTLSVRNRKVSLEAYTNRHRVMLY